MYMLLRFGPMLLVAGVVLIGMALKKRREQRRYQFEHRTSGGVVEFSSFDAAQAFNRSVVMWDLAKGLGVLLTLLGLMTLVRC